MPCMQINPCFRSSLYCMIIIYCITYAIRFVSSMVFIQLFSLYRSRVMEITEGSAVVTVTAERTLGEFKVQTGDVLCLDPTAADHTITADSTDQLIVHYHTD